MSIDVVSVCPKHGRTGDGIEATISIGGRRFCGLCFSEKLVELGVCEVAMKTIDRERIAKGPMVECECCGGSRPHTQDACPICGHQPPRDP